MKIFVDANIFKFSSSQLLRLKPREQTINWAGHESTSVVYDFVNINPNENIKNSEKLRKEVDLIPEIIALQADIPIEFCVTVESDFETWGIPDMDSQTGWLYGAGITILEAPISYSRILIGVDGDPMKDQYDFLTGITSDRFLQFQKATGAYQGKKPRNRNQLLDAFHLWSAEHNECDVFLTADFKLQKAIINKKGFDYAPRILLPSELLDFVDDTLYKKICRKLVRWMRKNKILRPLF